MGIIFFRGTVRATARRLIWMLLECKRLGTKRKKKKVTAGPRYSGHLQIISFSVMNS